MRDSISLSEYLHRQLRDARRTVNEQQEEIRRLRGQLAQAVKDRALP